MSEIASAFAVYGWELKAASGPVYVGNKTTVLTSTNAFLNVKLVVSPTQMTIVVEAIDSEKWKVHLSEKTEKIDSIAQAARTAEDFYRKMLNLADTL